MADKRTPQQKKLHAAEGYRFGAKLARGVAKVADKVGAKKFAERQRADSRVAVAESARLVGEVKAERSAAAKRLLGASAAVAKARAAAGSGSTYQRFDPRTGATITVRKPQR